MQKYLTILLLINLLFTFNVKAKSGFSFPPDLMPNSDVINPSQPSSDETVEASILPSISQAESPPQRHNTVMTLTITPSKKSYKRGEYMSLSIISNQSCYLTLVDFGTSGAVNILLPNKYQPVNHLQAGKDYSVPNEQFKLKIGGAKGKEKIWGICTKENTPVFRSHYDFNQHPFISLGQGQEITDFIKLPQQYNTTNEARDSATVSIQ